MPARTLRLAAIARATGQTRHQAKKDLRKIKWAYPPIPTQTGLVWDARAVDFLHAMRGQPHRTLEPAQLDWLARYLKETNASAAAQGAGSP